MAILTPCAPPICGAVTRQGGRCGHGRGWGTDHPGFGHCKLHGGSSPGGKKAAAKEAAGAFAVGLLGAEPECSPVDLMEVSVRLSRGMLLHYQREIATAAMATPIDTARLELLRPQFEQAIQRAAMVSKAALDAGVAERRQALAERTAALLTAVFMDAIQAGYGDVNTPERQQRAAVAIGRGISALEQGEAVEGTAREITA